MSGTVTVDGAVPKNASIKMDADPMCVKANKDPQFQETYVVTDGKLGDVTFDECRLDLSGWRFTRFDNVSFTVDQGESIGLMGLVAKNVGKVFLDLELDAALTGAGDAAGVLDRDAHQAREQGAWRQDRDGDARRQDEGHVGEGHG